jgi:RimJ/RimL family protein N-acetyltransferase
MTILTASPAESVDAGSPRDSHRDELAMLLDLDPASLPDHARLIEDLALDSLAMMKVIGWLAEHGVTIDTDRSWPTRVGDVLSLIGAAASPGLSVRVIGDAHLDRDSATGAMPAMPAPAQPSVDPLAPVLAGHGLRLFPVRPDDIGFLYSLAVRPETGFRWRYRGAPPSLERFTEDLWRQVLVQYLVRRTDDDQPVGQIVAYGADPALHYVYLGAVFAPPHTGTGQAAHAVAMFVRYLFHTFPISKVYLEVPGYNWDQLSSGEGALFEVEGVLHDHHQYAGRLWDQYICAIYRDRLPRDGA